jgi:hypothetical protein
MRRAAMAQMMPLRIGTAANCADGACGQVSRIIVNPGALQVTHLVVDPRHGLGPGRLVAVDLVDARTGQIRLRCTLAEFRTLPPAQETEVVPDLDPTGRDHPESPANRANWLGRSPFIRVARAPQEVTVDSVPSGEVDVRRDLTVCATDGELGQVRGLVVEPGSHRVTHVLLREGHRWSRKEVAIPVGAVTKFGTLLIHLSLTRHQVEHLPPADIRL